MHKARPYGLHAIGLPLTEKDSAFIDAVAKRVTNLKGASQVDSLKMVYNLPDGGYVIVQDMGGNFRAITHKPIHGKDPIFDGIETDYVPMLFSGVVTKPIVYENEPVELKLTEQARFRLVNYKYLEGKPAKTISLHRFRIGSDKAFDEFNQEPQGREFWTQYNSLRPTWYSGAMAEVMQIVGGYGRQDFANLPNEKVNRFERATVKLPSEWLARINSELEGLRLPAYTGLPPVNGTFQFDYRFNNTNAIGFDSERKPWLLRLAPNGVWAMPLPIVPATRTSAFRRYMELVGDDEIIAILNRFGAMPSGESFPSGLAFEDWRRAGVIIKVCDTADFYSNIMYSSACGWAVNDRGDEGYNTCYNYENDSRLAYGLTYKLRLRLAASAHYYGAKALDLVEDDYISDKVSQYLQVLTQTISNTTSEGRAIHYKLRLAGSSLIYQRALSHKGDKDKDYWLNLEMAPIANHGGSVSRVYKGYLYHSAKPEFQPQIKFPEPLLGACLSFDFLPDTDGRYKGKEPSCDTIMFAYYSGNALKVVKYFIDWGKVERSVVSDFENYMTAGNWEKTETMGSTQIMGHFYSTDIDERELVDDSVTVTRIVGVDKGYDSKPFFAQDFWPSMYGWLWRNRYFTHKTNTTTEAGKILEAAICIPYFCRSAAVQAHTSTIPSISKSESLQQYAVRDPNQYRYWTFDDLSAWWADGGEIKVKRGVPYPKDGSPVWVEELHYNPSPANNFADNGDWVGALPQDYTWLIHPNANDWYGSGGGGPPSTGEYSTHSPATYSQEGKVDICMIGQPKVISKKFEDAVVYHRNSPGPQGYYYYNEAVRVVFGGTTYYNFSDTRNDGQRPNWGKCSLVDSKSAHIFIGVINE